MIYAKTELWAKNGTINITMLCCTCTVHVCMIMVGTNDNQLRRLHVALKNLCPVSKWNFLHTK